MFEKREPGVPVFCVRYFKSCIAWPPRVTLRQNEAYRLNPVIPPAEPPSCMRQSGASPFLFKINKIF